jgi:hypothetical protein
MLREGIRLRRFLRDIPEGAYSRTGYFRRDSEEEEITPKIVKLYICPTDQSVSMLNRSRILCKYNAVRSLSRNTPKCKVIVYKGRCRYR